MNYNKMRPLPRLVTGFLAGLILSVSASAFELATDAPLVDSAALLRGQLERTSIGSSVRSGVSLDEEDAAIRLYFLDLITGTGTEKDGSVTFDLQRDLTRLEAAVMAVRLMGMEEQANGGTYDHPYTDVPEWAAGYVGYLWNCGLLEQSAEGLFSPHAPASVESFMSYLFYALGYRMADGDYNLLTAAV
ncbi:MAG: hypothetical protein IJX14_02530, partial [Clostridia bacterium]|nr:hypothetical protein [Clostridia bacterium]